MLGVSTLYNGCTVILEIKLVMEDIKIVHLKSNAQKLETWIAMINGVVVGHIYMEREQDQKIKFLDAWVHVEHRRKGIFRKLWDTRWEYVKTDIKDILYMLGVNQDPYHYFWKKVSLKVKLAHMLKK